MSSFVRGVGGWLRRRAENVAAAMLAVMFLAFIAQIVMRYVLGLPTGWTNELTVILWLWLVLFGCAFVVREDEEIRLDLIYSAAPAPARRPRWRVPATRPVGGETGSWARCRARRCAHNRKPCAPSDPDLQLSGDEKAPFRGSYHRPRGLSSQIVDGREAAQALSAAPSAAPIRADDARADWNRARTLLG